MKLKKEHIREEWNEGHPDSGGDGYWVALNTGWKSADDPVGVVHCIHEDTRRDAYRVGVLRCNCMECSPNTQGQGRRASGAATMADDSRRSL